jgi:MoxR-like ATPase
MTSPIPGDDMKRLLRLSEAFADIRQEIAKAIVGQDEVVEQLLIAIFSNGHCILEGVPGLAKTLLVSTLARSLDLSFARIQFTPDLMPSDITGTEVLEEDRATGSRTFRFISGPIFHSVILADEINRTPPKTQAALLEGMQEHQVSAAGTRHPLPDPFFVLATQNPIEQEGTYPLPEAQMDRFLFKIVVDYPEVETEREIYRRVTSARQETPTPVLGREGILMFQDLVRRVPINDVVMDYALRLVRNTRHKEASAPDFIKNWVLVGSGPRGGLALISAAKVRAALHGRVEASIQDVQAVALPVLRHRLILNYTAMAEGQSPDSIISKLLESTSLTADQERLDDRIQQVLKS